MILWRFKSEPETRGEGFSCSAFRWVLEVGNWFVGLTNQYQINGEWQSSHTTIYHVGLRWPFRFGSEHFYYDGPHCTVNLGFAWIGWGGRNCRKCMLEDEET